MTAPSTASVNFPYAAMSLAAITYLDETNPAKQQADMSSALSALDASAGGPWTLRWGPAIDAGILVFVAQSASAGWAVAIRGSLSSAAAAGFFSNWIEDADAVSQQPWLYPQSVAGAQIASGTNEALDAIMGLTDPTTDLSLLDYLRSALPASGGSLLV